MCSDLNRWLVILIFMTVRLHFWPKMFDGFCPGEGSEEDEEGFHFGVIEEAPKPAFQPLKERPQEMGSRWKKAEARWRREGMMIKGVERVRVWWWWWWWWWCWWWSSECHCIKVGYVFESLGINKFVLLPAFQHAQASFDGQLLMSWLMF